jgi:hypothetical protein
MPRIPPQVLYSAFYLYPSVESAKAGDKFGGTGFFVAYPTDIPEAPSLLYAVTNWHVAVRDGASVMRVNKISGGFDIFDFDPSEWEFPPGGPDLAVIPHLKLGVKESVHEIVALHLNIFLTKPDIAEMGIAAGEDVFMVGRFVDHDGAASNVPAVRFGNISVMPQPLEQPTGAKLESFVLDVHSRTGYSGSPVFVYRTFGSDLTTDQMVTINQNIYGTFSATHEDHFVKFLGLHWGQFPEQWEIKTKAKKSISEAVLTSGDPRYIEGMSGMTVALPAWTIREFLDLPKHRKERDVAINQILAARGPNRGPVAETAAPPATDESPNHLKDFTRPVDVGARKRPQGDRK